MVSAIVSKHIVKILVGNKTAYIILLITLNVCHHHIMIALNKVAIAIPHMHRSSVP